MNLVSGLKLTACLLVAVTATLVAQQPSDPTEVLAKARDIIVARGKRLPDYTCVQTVDRQYFKPLHSQFPPASCAQIAVGHKAHPDDLVLQATDRLRLDLKVSQGVEIGAWAGSRRFSSSSVFDLIGGGAFGTGTLGTFFGDIFESGAATYNYMGEETADGHKFSVYRYRVPVASSHYQVKTDTGWTPTGFIGVFWIDSDSLDLRRLIVDANEMPPETGGCQATTTVEYQKMQVGAGSFLLPIRSSMLMSKADATETRVAAVYSGCREYHGDATIRFDNAAAAGEVHAVAPVAPLPAGLPLSLALSSPIDTDTAAAGDILSAKLRKSISVSNEVLAPAGAKVEGRLIQIRHWLEEPRHFSISLMLETLEVHGVPTPLYARLSREAGSTSIHLGPAVQFPLVAAFVVTTNKSRYVVPAGYRSNWVTVEPPH